MVLLKRNRIFIFVMAISGIFAYLYYLRLVSLLTPTPHTSTLTLSPKWDGSQLLVIPTQEKAFFIETMGNSILDWRQSCAVESLALQNPLLTINVLMTGGKLDGNFSLTRQLVQRYANLQFIPIDLDDYFNETLLADWYFRTAWREGPYHVSHLSDALRFLTIFKYGGYYFDLDMVQVKSVMGFRNFTAIEDGTVVSASAIHASYGHPLMEMAVHEFASNYNPKEWGYNGPLLMTRVLQSWCGTPNLTSMNLANCKGFRILPKTAFYPVHFKQWKEFFIQQPPNKISKWLTNEVIGVHVWNKKSSKEALYKNSTQPYVKIARISCPVTFSSAPDTF